MTRRAIIISSLLIILAGCNLPSGAMPTTTPEPTPLPPPTHTLSPTRRPTSTRTATSTAFPTPTVGASPTAESTHPPQTTPLPLFTKGSEVTVTSITMVTGTKGWAIGHQGSSPDHILYTEDGGETWLDRTPPTMQSQTTDQPIRAKGFFLDEDRGLVKLFVKAPPPPLDPQFVWRTTDAGKTWQASQPLPLIGQEFYFIPTAFSFIDQDQGWLLVHVDSGMNKNYSNLYVTKDGGDSWERVHDPMGSGVKVGENTGMLFANEKLGWVTKDATVVDKGPFIEKTTDGGYTWHTLFLPSPEKFDFSNREIYCRTNNPVFTSSQTRLLLLTCENAKEEKTYQYVYATTDGGENWQHTQLPTPVSELEFMDYQTGYALGRNIYRTDNGGEVWQKIKTVFWDGEFSFVNENQGWAVARKGEDIALVRTQDGAKSWQILDPIIAP